MLKELIIQNFAIIDDLQLEFDRGFTVLTGETGAGKSILIGALALLLGERADSSQLQPEKKCILEAHFDVASNHRVQNFLESNDVDQWPVLIIRREIVAGGKSRIFLNDSPTTLQLIQSLAPLLIDLHRQFDTIEIRDKEHQLDLLDQLHPDKSMLIKFRELYQQWHAVHTEFRQLQAQNRKAKQDQDYDQFLFDELNQLKLQSGELEDAEERLKILQHAESSLLALNQSLYLIGQGETSVLSQLRQLIQRLDHIPAQPAVQAILDRLRSCQIELKDLEQEIESLHSALQADPEKMQQLSDRLNDGNRLLKKHQCKTSDELIQVKEKLEVKLAAIQLQDQRENELHEVVQQLWNDLEQAASLLHLHRKELALMMQQQVNLRLAQVGMPNAEFAIQLNRSDLGASGSDQVEFMLDANKSGQFRPLIKVASGGELSRLMLCIKSLLAANSELPALLFDEIDTGISGETAMQVGSLLKQLASNHQVICITHLPQIAAKAGQHYLIYKSAQANRNIRTQVKLLSQDERVEALAEMMGGKQKQTQSLEMARNWMGAS